MKKPKLCILMRTHWSHTMGGAEYQVKCLMEVLIKENKYDLYYITKKVDPLYQPSDYKIVTINSRFQFLSKGYSLFDSIQLTKILNKIRPDLIYQRTGNAHTGIAAFYAKKNNCRLFWHIAHDDDVKPYQFSLQRTVFHEFIEKKFLEYGVRNASFIIAQTKDQQSLLKSTYGISITKVIHNFHPFPTESLIKKDPAIILWIANLKPMKNPDIFLKLSKEISTDLNNTRFIMIGAMQGSNSWFQKIEKDLSRVEYIGSQSQEKVNELLAKAHILINTSNAEGFSNTFIQAWMRKVPVISLYVNPDKTLTENKIGFCSGNYNQLIKDTKKLICDNVLRETMGKNAQEYAFNNHSINEASKLVHLMANSIDPD